MWKNINTILKKKKKEKKSTILPHPGISKEGKLRDGAGGRRKKSPDLGLRPLGLYQYKLDH